MAEEEDIISTLPDAILCHILSFLRTKQSVATSILSKRWHHIWRSVPALNLGPTSLVNNNNAFHRFIDFVNSVLLSLDPALPINTFILYFLYNSHGPPINRMDSITKWVNFVVQRGVQYFDLYADSEVHSLPISILTCSTLVVLKIDNFKVEKGFDVTLPSLKTLHLHAISFPQHRDFMLFLAECQILEDLYTFDISFDSEESLTSDEWKSFSLTNLTTANIDCYRSSMHFPLKVVHNVSSLRLEIGQEDYLGDFIPTFRNLTKLDFVCYSNWKFVVEILKHCPKLQELRLNEATPDEEYEFWIRMDANWVDPDFVPQCLSLHLRTCYFSSCFDIYELMLAKYILKNAEVLQTMEIWNSGETKIKRQLSSCPRASATCKLTVYYAPEIEDDFEGNVVEADNGNYYVEEDEFEGDL